MLMMMVLLLLQLHTYYTSFTFLDGRSVVSEQGASRGSTWLLRLRGLVVRIVACQVMDPGSNPEGSIALESVFFLEFLFWNTKKPVLARVL